MSDTNQLPTINPPPKRKRYSRRSLALMSGATVILNDGKVVPFGVMIHNMRKAFYEAERADKAITAATIEGITDPQQAFEVLKAKVQIALDLRDKSQQYARDAAPYVHPRLSAIAVRQEDLAPPSNPEDAKLVEAVANPQSPLMLELAAWDAAGAAFEEKIAAKQAKPTAEPATIEDTPTPEK